MNVRFILDLIRFPRGFSYCKRTLYDCSMSTTIITISSVQNSCVHILLHTEMAVYKETNQSFAHSNYSFSIHSSEMHYTVAHLSVRCSRSTKWHLIIRMGFMFSSPTEQQYFDIDKRLAESQEQILSATKDLQALKEENKKLCEFSPLLLFQCIE